MAISSPGFQETTVGLPSRSENRLGSFWMVLQRNMQIALEKGTSQTSLWVHRAWDRRPGSEGGGGSKDTAARAPPARLLPRPGPATPRSPRRVPPPAPRSPPRARPGPAARRTRVGVARSGLRLAGGVSSPGGSRCHPRQGCRHQEVTGRPGRETPCVGRTRKRRHIGAREGAPQGSTAEKGSRGPWPGREGANSDLDGHLPK